MCCCNGRQLTLVQIDENTTMALEYDENGMRSRKTIETLVAGDVLKEEFSYYYASGSLVGMWYRNWYDGYAGESWVIWFLYDEKGEMIGLTNGAETYYYVKNMQGDVLALIDIEGNVAAKYQYDLWGKVVSVKKADGTELTAQGHIGHVNPIRYRGYVYDRETELYYLSSRYYDPETGRFVNADGYVSTGQGLLGHNMFAYCNNNPVNYVDPSGEFALLALYILLKIGNDMADAMGIEDGFIGALIAQTQKEAQNRNNVVGGYHVINDRIKYRIDQKGTDYEHIHLNENGKEYDQYKKGGKDRHNKNKNNKSGPSNKTKKILKEKGIWDWDGNIMNYDISSDTETQDIVTSAAVGVGVGVVTWQVIKWAIAGLAAPSTAGTSLVIAGSLP